MQGPVPYPLFARLDGERVVVVGAGDVAARKVAALLECGADVSVIAPEAGEAVRQLVREGAIRWEPRPYRTSDLGGAVLAIAATPDRALNELIARDARTQRTLVNVVDEPDLCTFTVPSVMRRGKLQVAVSTDGASPTVARSIRRNLEDAFPSWWEAYIDLLADVRSLVKRRVPGGTDARAPLYEAVAHAGLEERVAVGETPTPEDVYGEVVLPLVEGRTR